MRPTEGRMMTDGEKERGRSEEEGQKGQAGRFAGERTALQGRPAKTETGMSRDAQNTSPTQQKSCSPVLTLSHG